VAVGARRQRIRRKRVDRSRSGRNRFELDRHENGWGGELLGCHSDPQLGERRENVICRERPAVEVGGEPNQGEGGAPSEPWLTSEHPATG